MRNRTNLILLIAVVVCTVLLIVFTRIPVGPDTCAICSSIPYHAPCLINLSTGRITELMVYEPHESKVAELADEQSGGTLGYMMVNDLFITRDTISHETQAEIPINGSRINKKLYCGKCRKALRSLANKGYALADLYDRETPQLYSIEGGGHYSMRCYLVDVAVKPADGAYIITITGTLE